MATRDQTTLNVTVTDGVHMPSGAVSATAAGGTVTVVLDEGQFLQILNSNPDSPGGLTGSKIVADKPIAAFSGADLGQPGSGGYFGDKLEEMLYPVETWGTTFVGTDLGFAQNAMDMKNGENYWTVLASEAGTDVTLTPNPGVTFDTPLTFTLGAGAWRKIGARLPNLTSYADFMMTSTKPIQVLHSFGKSPSATIGIPVDQFLTRYLFIAHPYFKDQLVVTRKVGTTVNLDGIPMAGSMFTPVEGGFEIARVAMPSCLADTSKCAHVVTGEKVGLAMVGWHEVCGGYAYVAGIGTKCINPGGTAGGTCPE